VEYRKVSLTSEQLQTARAERWRHTSNPLLTADDARAWLDTAGLCLFLPRRRQFLAPAPSFVEACSGAPSETPTREAIENAATIMHRLAADASILPLNLFGALSEQPDFLASREAFPYVFSLRGTRDWKTVPAGETSPLVIRTWTLLEKEGALSAPEIVSTLGRELTEAAVLRGLIELWSGLRVLPEYETGRPTRWNLTQARFKAEVGSGSKLSQTTALSALVSLYLESAIAATSEEVETFLSPLTSRSKVRETVNGLTATRQLSMTPMGTQSMFYIAGTLPEFAEPEPAAEAVGEAGSAAPHTPRSFDRERKPFERKTGDRGPARERTPGKSDGERKPWPRKEAGERSERAPFGKRPSFGKKPFDRSAKPYDKAARPFRREAGTGEGERSGSGERSSFRPAAGRGGPARGTGGKFPPKKFGFRSEGSRSEGARSGSSKPEGRSGRPYTSRPSSPRPGGPRREATGERGASTDSPRPFRPRREDSGDRPRSPRPFNREGGGERRTGGFAGKPKFGGAKKFDGPRSSRPRSSNPRSSGTGSSGPRSFGPRSFGPRTGASKFEGPKSGFPKSGTRGKAPEGEKRPFFRKRSDEGSAGESRPRSFSRPSSGSARSSDGPSRPGGAWKGKPAGGSGFSRPASKFSKEGTDKPRSSRPAFGKAGSSKPGFSKPGFSKSGPSKSGRPSFGKSSFSKGKPGGGSFKGNAAGGKKFGGPKKFGSARPGGKPGGAKPPFRKRKDSEGGSKSAE
jgi:23S rRNA pseudouridine2605 synthase